MQENYADTLMRLQDIFYLYKNESLDELTDDELLEYMEEKFDGICAGDLDYLEGTVLDTFAREVRTGTKKYIGNIGRMRHEYRAENRSADRLWNGRTDPRSSRADRKIHLSREQLRLV